MSEKLNLRAHKAIALIAGAALLLTGCSAAAGGTTSLSTAPVPKEKTTLTVWSFLPENYDNGTAAYKEVIAGFEKQYPQVTVDLVNMSYPTYFDQVRSATVARKGPDVVTMYGGAQAYSYKNGLYPLQDAMQPDVKKNLKFVADNFSQDGNLYMLPTGTYGYSLLVNQSEFARAGIDAKAGLKDWPSLLNTCRSMSAQGIQPIASGWKDGFLFETFMYMISSQMMDASTLKDWVAGKIDIDSSLFQKATQRIVEMNDAHCFGGDASLGRNMYDDAFNQYYTGKAAMAATGSLSTAEKGYAAIPSSTVMPLPQVPESQNPSLIDAGAEAGWAVTKWTKSPEAATAFANYLAGAEAQSILWKTAGVPPNRADLAVEGNTAMQKAFLPLIENAENHSGFPAFPLPVLSVFERNAGPLISGSMTQKTFLDQAQSAFAKAK